MSKKKKKRKFDKNKNRKLYDKYIKPNERDVETLVGYYSTIPQIREDVIAGAKANFFSYMHTYDESKSLDTWIHIVTKRFVFQAEADYSSNQELFTDYLNSENIQNADGDYTVNSPYDPLDMEFYRRTLDDTLYNSLMDLREDLRIPFLLLSNGYSVREITQHELDRGAISWMSYNAIKTRIKMAKELIKKRIKHHKKYSSMRRIAYYVNQKDNRSGDDNK